MNRIYIMLSPRYPYRHKVGISVNAEKRRQQIDRTVTGRVFRFLSIPVPNAKRVEKKMHRILSPFAAPIKKKNGRTNGEKEWFWILNPWSAYGLWLFAPDGYWVLALLPIPFDTAAALIVTSCSIWAAIAAFVAGSAYLILF